MPRKNMFSMNVVPNTGRSTRKAVIKFSSKDLHRKMSAAQSAAAKASAKSAKGFHGRLKAHHSAKRVQEINDLSSLFGRLGH